MSVEAVRQKVFKRFADFTPIDNSRKSYPNRPEAKQPASGLWASLVEIQFVMNKVASIGREPCTRRTGTIIIDIFERLGEGTKNMAMMVDEMERHFGLWTDGNLWTGPSNHTGHYNEDRAYHRMTVYVPFTYDED